MKKSIIFGAGLIMAVSCVGGAKKEEAPSQVAEVVPVVQVEEATTMVVSDDQAYSGTVQPWAKNHIAPQSAGRIEELLVEVGDYVTAGQIVAKMDDVQLQQAELQVNNDKVEYDRLKTLHEQGGVSQSDFDSFEMACKVHRSTYENLLKNTVLRSPVTGVISARNYDSGDMYAMSQPLYVVEQIVPVKLLIGISEADYSRVSKGDKTSISVDAFPGQSFPGVISNIFPTIDAATHTFTVEVKVSNANRRLRPGMYSKVTVTFDNAERVIVPDNAVVKQQGSGDRYVYKLNDDSTVSYVKVNPGRRLGDKYVILDGVSAGEKVVTEGILRIKDGIKVNVK